MYCRLHLRPIRFGGAFGGAWTLPRRVPPNIIDSILPSTHVHSSQSARQRWTVSGLSKLRHRSPSPAWSCPCEWQCPTNCIPTCTVVGHKLSQVPTSIKPGSSAAEEDNAFRVASTRAVYGQPGQLNMLALPSPAQSQADTSPNSASLGQSQEEEGHV